MHHAFLHVTVGSAIIGIGNYSYVAVFLLTFLSGHLIPLPEEIILLVVGYSAGIGVVDFWLALPAAMGGLLVMDIFLFVLGHHGGKLVKKLEHRLPQKTLNRYHKRFLTKPVATIVGLRFISGLRILSPIFAAVWKIPFRVFLLADFGALCAFVFLFMGLGFFFHDALLELIGRVAILRHLIFLSLLIVIGIVIGAHVYRIFFLESKEEKK